MGANALRSSGNVARHVAIDDARGPLIPSAVHDLAHMRAAPHCAAWPHGFVVDGVDVCLVVFTFCRRQGNSQLILSS